MRRNHQLRVTAAVVLFCLAVLWLRLTFLAFRPRSVEERVKRLRRISLHVPLALATLLLAGR